MNKYNKILSRLEVKAIFVEIICKLEIIQDKNCSHGCGMYAGELVELVKELEGRVTPKAQTDCPEATPQ